MNKSLITSIALVGGSTILTGLVNYAYHPIMLQYLTLSDFGEFGSIVGFFNILGVVASGFSLFFVREIASSIGDNKQLSLVYRQAITVTSLVGCMLFVITALLSPFIIQYLNISQGLIPLMFAGSSVVFSFVGIAPRALLQGKELFFFISWSGVLGAILKLLIGWFLVHFGYGVIGATFGFALSGLIILILYYQQSRQFHPLRLRPTKTKTHSPFNIGSISRFLLLSLFLSFIINGDVMVAKNILNDTDAGGYVAVSMIAKFVIFVGMAIETVYYPKIIKQTTNQTAIHSLRDGSALILLLCAIAVLGSYFTGDSILPMIKPELAAYSQHLPVLVGFGGLCGLINFYSKILMAKEDGAAIRITGLGGLLRLIYIYTNNVMSIYNITTSLVGVATLIMIVLLIRISTLYKHP